MTVGRSSLAFALALVLCGSLAGILLRPLLPVDETRYVSVAWEMWAHSNWLTPHLNGQPYPDKPPLLFWSIHALWAVFGVSQTAARIVPALYAIALVGVTALLAHRLWPARPGIDERAALILAGSTLFVLTSTLVMFDTALAVAVLVGMLGLAEQRHGSVWRGWALFGSGIGLGVLCKGPVVLVHLLPPALLAPLWWRDGLRPRWSRWYLGVASALLLGAAIALAWAIPAGIAGGQAYRQAIFWGQSAGRMVEAFAHQRPFWWYIPVVVAALFPWLLWPRLWSALASLRDELDDPLRMILIWACASFAIFSAISGKQVHYLVPLLPAFALLSARLLEAPLGAALQRSKNGHAWLPFGVFVAGGVAVTGFLSWIAAGHAVTPALDALPLWFGPAIIASALILLLVGRGSYAPLALASSVYVAFIVAEVAGRSALQAYDLAAIARLAKTYEAGGIASLGKYRGEISFLGRLEQPVAVLGDAAEARFWAASHPGGMILEHGGASLAGPGLREVFRQPYRGGEAALWAAAPQPR